MLEPIFTLRDQAALYHRLLPETVRQYLNRCGIPDAMIERYTLGWNGRAITIPVEDRDGTVVYLKTAKPPSGYAGAPTIENPPGVRAELFPWSAAKREPRRIVICENELDSLVLEARGFPAVSPTGGGEAFDQAWAKDLENIARVYVCFGRAQSDGAAERIVRMIPRARVVKLPEAIGPKGGLTDFFVRLANTRNDFEWLLAASESAAAPQPDDDDEPFPTPRFLKRAEELKANVPIGRVIGEYTMLRRSKKYLKGRCPLHEKPNPMLRVYPKENTFQCLACGAGGDAISFLQTVESLTFGQALEALEKIRYADEESDAA